MARKQRNQISPAKSAISTCTSVEKNSTIQSSVDKDSTIHNQLHSQFNWYNFFPEISIGGCDFSLDFSDISLSSTELLPLDENFLSTLDVMNQESFSEIKKCSAAQSSAAETTTEARDSFSTSSAFPNQWYEVQNVNFLNADTTLAGQTAMPGPSQTVQSTDFYQLLSLGSSNQDTEQQAAASQSFIPDPTNMVSANPGTSRNRHMSASAQSHEAQRKLKKKRSIEESADFGDSDSDISDDGSSDNEDDGEPKINPCQFAEKFLDLRSTGKPCNFWQYNSQSRGPKGKRLHGEIVLKDCHVLDEFTDPVTHCDSIAGNRGASKLRHGEGNDPKPDAHKLLEIGAQIGQLEDEFKTIKSANRDDVTRQKNKLASRICRLKKKAQHEANKIKLEGLREEHENLVALVARLVIMMETSFMVMDTTKAMTSNTTSSTRHQPSLCPQLESLIRSHLSFMIAGHTTEYVNTQIEKAARKNASGRQIT